ncbi:MAG: 2Fe-2S iron-sulfur cluster-binding protein, partial [Planctomycetota bacterium]
MKHYQIQFQPDNLTTLIHKGATLLEAAGQVGIILSTPCGSAGRCGKCKVRLLPSEKEVLACQYIIDGDLTVLVPESSRFYQQQILEHGIDRKVAAMASIRKVFIENP